ncbi:hypothetical protein [Haemophilus paracuniculus]|nr:hypothetical protein [Haemophilus paracuniculus]
MKSVLMPNGYLVVCLTGIFFIVSLAENPRFPQALQLSLATRL